MKVKDFYDAIENLTGSPVEEKIKSREERFLKTILEDDGRQIGCSQLNELLLLLDKNRIEEPFFKYFFGENCQIGNIKQGVKKFQIKAMLRYGNFIHAFRTLSRKRTEEDLLTEIGDEKRIDFKQRKPKLIDINKIKKEDTPLVGYLSASLIIKDNAQCAVLIQTIENLPSHSDWKHFKKALFEYTQENEHASLLRVIEHYLSRSPNASIKDFLSYLKRTSPTLGSNENRLKKVRKIAERNLDIYLTWDHMDVYFATSMRKSWEYEDLFDFIQGLMEQSEFSNLELRYFDPTQSYTEDRIDKGLVESLMLKRAACTVYSVQDTDTLGKDSELAATLAQGKPVIAYVPKIDPKRRKTELLTKDPLTISERLRFVLYADEQFSQVISEADYDFVRDFRELDDYIQNYIWRSLPADDADDFKKRHQQQMGRLCGIIAESEKRIYDKRATTLKETHPLALQINLNTGVANGVLVVRTIAECASLLKSILTKTMSFKLVPGETKWYLREVISRSVYRVVTKHRKLTNSFWNFYLRQ